MYTMVLASYLAVDIVLNMIVYCNLFLSLSDLLYSVIVVHGVIFNRIGADCLFR